MRKSSLINVSLVGLLGVTYASSALNHAGAAALVAPANALDAKLATMAPGTWADLASTNLSSVVWPGPYICIGGGTAAIMSAWNGAVNDTDHDQLIVWGGGHQDYCGNEVYVFKYATLTWQRLDNPSPLADAVCNSGSGSRAWEFTDGRPVNIHTYYNLAYVPGKGMMAVGSGPVDGTLISGCTTVWNGGQWTHIYNPATTTWTRTADATLRGSTVDEITVYDSVSGMVYAFDQVDYLQKYNPSTNVWSCAAGGSPAPTGCHSTAFPPDYHMTAAVKPGSQMVLVGGAGTAKFTAMSLVSSTIGQTLSATFSGDATIPAANAPGFSYDSTADKFVGWNGGRTLYLMDPSTYTFTSHSAGGDTPTAPQSNGTFGRFQCLQPAHNGCIVVNAINQDVYLYKPDF